jgi:hypothetical protein
VLLSLWILWSKFGLLRNRMPLRTLFLEPHNHSSNCCTYHQANCCPYHSTTFLAYHQANCCPYHSTNFQAYHSTTFLAYHQAH